MLIVSSPAKHANNGYDFKNVCLPLTERSIPSNILKLYLYMNVLFAYNIFTRQINADKKYRLSLSYTGHTVYTVVHSCKPYIQPNQP